MYYSVCKGIVIFWKHHIIQFAKVLLFFGNTKGFWIKMYGEHNFVIKLL